MLPRDTINKTQPVCLSVGTSHWLTPSYWQLLPDKSHELKFSFCHKPFKEDFRSAIKKTECHQLSFSVWLQISCDLNLLPKRYLNQSRLFSGDRIVAPQRGASANFGTEKRRYSESPRCIWSQPKVIGGTENWLRKQSAAKCYKENSSPLLIPSLSP